MPEITLKEAIEILEGEAHLAERQPETGVYDALKLLILAGERIKAKRLDHWVLITPLLPGEAPE